MPKAKEKAIYGGAALQRKKSELVCVPKMRMAIIFYGARFVVGMEAVTARSIYVNSLQFP